jgi:hypothetical protein
MDGNRKSQVDAMHRQNRNAFLNSELNDLAMDERAAISTAGNGLNLLQNSLITIVYAQNDVCTIYVNGVQAGQITTAEGSLSAGNLFIGHTDQAKTFDTTFRSIRFYSRALSAEEVAANAAVDGFGN